MVNGSGDLGHANRELRISNISSTFVTENPPLAWRVAFLRGLTTDEIFRHKDRRAARRGRRCRRAADGDRWPVQDRANAGRRGLADRGGTTAGGPTRLRMFLIALALLPGACDGLPSSASKSSITVQLPEARPATPQPGFSHAAAPKAVSAAAH